MIRGKYRVLSVFLFFLMITMMLSGATISLEEQRAFLRSSKKEADKRAKNIQLILPKIIKKLKENNEDKKENAAFYLGESQDPNAIEPLLMVLNDKHYSMQVKNTALKALNKLMRYRHNNVEIQNLTDTKIVPKLKDLIRDQKIWDKKDYQYLSELACGLYYAGDKESYELAEQISDYKPSMLKMFGSWDVDQYPTVYKIDLQAKPILIRALLSNNEKVKFQAVEMLNIAGYKDEIFETIVDIIKYGKDHEIRWKCLWMLDKLGDERSKAVIVEATDIKELKAHAERILEWWDKKHGSN